MPNKLMQPVTGTRVATRESQRSLLVTVSLPIHQKKAAIVLRIVPHNAYGMACA
jgi:hypothetical protein